MRRTIFLTFADTRLRGSLKRIRRQARSLAVFDEIRAWDQGDLDPGFRRRHAERLQPGVRGYGYWIWKPEVILRTLDSMAEGDILLYADVGCHLNADGRDRLLEYVERVKRSSLGFLGVRVQDVLDRDWTKGDLLDHLGVRDRKDITDTPSIAAGTLWIRKGPGMLAMLRSWQQVMETDISLIDDSPSQAPNLPGFREHRHDQAVLSILAKVAGVETLDPHECYPTAEDAAGAPDWSTMTAMPIWHRRDKEFKRPWTWHGLRLLSRVAPTRALRSRLRSECRRSLR